MVNPDTLIILDDCKISLINAFQLQGHIDAYLDRRDSIT